MSTYQLVDLAKAHYDPSQARDKRGQWTDGVTRVSGKGQQFVHELLKIAQDDNYSDPAVLSERVAAIYKADKESAIDVAMAARDLREELGSGYRYVPDTPGVINALITKGVRSRPREKFVPDNTPVIIRKRTPTDLTVQDADKSISRLVDLAFDPAQPRDKIGRWYHGTSAILKPGDILKPGKTIGKANFDYPEGGQGNPFVYITNEIGSAVTYSQLSASRGHKGGPNKTLTQDPHIYEVEPLGKVEADANASVNNSYGGERQVPLARVVREVKIKENRNGARQRAGLKLLPELDAPMSEIVGVDSDPEPVMPENGTTKTYRKAMRAWLNRRPASAKNVVALWDEATSKEKMAGLGWYNDAHKVAFAVAKKRGISVEAAAGLLAVYSPQKAWGQNQIEADTVARLGKGIGGPGSGVMATRAQAAQANRILAGEDPEIVLGGTPTKTGLSSTSGMKIRSFYKLIAEGSDLDLNHPAVVVDRHAIGVTRGIAMSDNAYGLDGDHSSRAGYANYRQVFTDAAKTISEQMGKTISPHQVQAATWLTRQRLNASANTRNGKTRKTLGGQDWEKWEQYAAKFLPELSAELGKMSATTGYADANLSNETQPRVPAGNSHGGEWGSSTKAAPVEAPAVVIPAGWFQIMPGNYIGPHGHTVLFDDPAAYSELARTYFVKRASGALKASGKASSVINESPILIHVPTPADWEEAIVSTSNGRYEGSQVAGYTRRTRDISISPMAVEHRAQPLGTPLPAIEKIPFSQSTITHEIGHILANRTRDDVNKEGVWDSAKGKLSTYADSGPGEGYAEAWSEWVFEHARKHPVPYGEAAVAAKAYADAFGWEWNA